VAATDSEEPVPHRGSFDVVDQCDVASRLRQI